MVQEKRELVVTKNAVLAMLKHAQTSNAAGLPPGDIRDAVVLSDGTCEVTVLRLGGQIETISLPAPKVMAVFIAYARKRGIPMPRMATKRIAGSRDAVVITMTMAVTV